MRVNYATKLGLKAAFAAALLCSSAVGQTAVQWAAAAKAGFRNETEIAVTFVHWRTDDEARGWLAATGYVLLQFKINPALLFEAR